MPRETYRKPRPYGFCPGCSHGRILDALDRALVRLQWDASEVVIVTDIGCVGLSDQYFATSAFHGLHGRSLAYATGIKVARPDLHVIVLIGDGGCGIGGAHLLNAARRNIGITTIVFNNLNFGMTGGEHSVTTPPAMRTSTTPWGHLERPLDIAGTVALNGATYVWRGTAFDAELTDRLEEALRHPGFALLEVWELCVAYFAAMNRLSAKRLKALMEEQGFRHGLLCHEEREEYSHLLQRLAASRQETKEPPLPYRPLAQRFLPQVKERQAIVIAGSAGGRVRTAGHLVGKAAALSGLWATQRDDYPVTVRSGHSVSEVLIAPREIRYTGVEHPDLLVLLSEDGYRKVKHHLEAMPADAWLVVPPAFADLPTTAQKLVIDPVKLGARGKQAQAMAMVAAATHRRGYFTKETLLAAAEALHPRYAAENRRVVAAALASEAM